MPLNCNAPPYLPDVDHVAFVTEPLFPFPDASVTVEPDPSSNAYAATIPDGSAEVVAADDGCGAASAAWNGGLEQLFAKNLPTAVLLPLPVKCPEKW